MRVTESKSGMDIIFNYGTFLFNDEFYPKFVRGKLLYYLSIENFNSFMHDYQLERRGIIEQTLELNCAEKQKLFEALKLNARDDNKFFKYDFLFDNCTTRLRDIVKNTSDSPVFFNNILPPKTPTFRNLIHSYLNNGGQYWSKLGIDMLLGSKMDAYATNEQAMFLPEYLMKGFDNGVKDEMALVQSKDLILPVENAIGANKPLFTPFLVFLVLFLLIAPLQFVKQRWAYITLNVFDTIFFLLVGLSGVLMLFMWFGTDHALCANNYNLLWALPTHTIMAFFVHQHKKWVKQYFTVSFWITILIAFIWVWIPQQLPIALTPVVLLLVLRSYQRSSYNRKNLATEQLV